MSYGGLAMEIGDNHLPEPREEAAFFYGLFLRGQPIEKLREDIDVAPQVIERWQRLALSDPWSKSMIERILQYRKHVLAIFDSLVFHDVKTAKHIQ